MKTLYTITIFVFYCCSNIYAQESTAKNQRTNTAKLPESSQFKNLEYKIIDAPDKTFGYDIYSDNRLLIHQPLIPAMPGNNGFETREGAQKVAQLVIIKINKGEMPPTVSINEMKNMGVIK